MVRRKPKKTIAYSPDAVSRSRGCRPRPLERYDRKSFEEKDIGKADASNERRRA